MSRQLKEQAKESPGTATADATAIATMLWRRLDAPGHDSACLRWVGDDWLLTGVAVFGHEGRACCLAYDVTCDATWRTRLARVSGWVGSEPVEREIRALDGGRWLLDGVEVQARRGCLDVDLALTPATNLLSIRRLGLEVGHSAPVAAAWLRFPELDLERLEQRYERTAADRYAYESGGGTFRATLGVDARGFVADYPGLWIAEGLPARETRPQP
jgi:uncharacterized protein